MLRALNRNVPRVFNPDRKDTHRGMRKLKGMNSPCDSVQNVAEGTGKEKSAG
jgi:hypothetical protein